MAAPACDRAAGKCLGNGRRSGCAACTVHRESFVSIRFRQTGELLVLRGSLYRRGWGIVLGLFAALLLISPAKWESGGDVSIAVKLPFAAVFAAVGLWLWRSNGPITIDRAAGTLTHRAAAFSLAPAKTQDLRDFTAVRINRETRRVRKKNGYREYDVYCVRLQSKQDPLLLDEPRQYLPARRIAERIAAFVHVPLADAGSGPETVRDPDDINKPLQTKLRESAVRTSWPPPLEDNRVVVERAGDETILILPRPKKPDAFTIVIEIVGTGIVLWIATLLTRTFLRAYYLPVLAGLIVLGALASIAYSRKQTVVIVSLRGLRIEHRYRWITDRETLNVDALEELRQGPRELAAFSDVRTLHFGETLHPDEREWVASAICAALLGERPHGSFVGARVREITADNRG